MSRPTTMQGLEDALRRILDGAGWQIDYDNSGQVIIYTGLAREGDRLVPHEPDDEYDDYEEQDDASPEESYGGFDDDD